MGRTPYSEIRRATEREWVFVVLKSAGAPLTLNAISLALHHRLAVYKIRGVLRDLEQQGRVRRELRDFELPIAAANGRLQRFRALAFTAIGNGGIP